MKKLHLLYIENKFPGGFGASDKYLNSVWSNEILLSRAIRQLYKRQKYITPKNTIIELKPINIIIETIVINTLDVV